jgi:hypothetical protein
MRESEISWFRHVACLVNGSFGASRAIRKYWLVPVLLLGGGTGAQADVKLGNTSLTLEVGHAEQLHLDPAGTEGAQWESSDSRILEVCQNGFVIGLRPGEARVRLRNSSAATTPEYVVTVKVPQTVPVEAATLRQYPDSREFTLNGRKCFGSELNGQRAVSPEERRYTRSNRVVNPRPLDPERPLEWEVQDGTEVYDGAGVLMGTVAAELRVSGRRVPASMFNFGMSKILGGRLCLYAFSVPIKPSPAVTKLLDPADDTREVVRTSAWLPLDRVVDKNGLLERIGVGRPGMPILPLEARPYRITGGKPKLYETEFGELSIIHDVSFGAVPSHYLRRPSGTINVIYSVPGFGLGGQGLDSFLVSDDLDFYPAKGAKVFVQPTYFPPRHPEAGKVSPKTMTFIYGAVKVKGAEPVYGWVAREAMGE